MMIRLSADRTGGIEKTVVISQPMYFPWVGLLEQIRLSDIFVFYDDVQFSKGSLFNRIQVKISNGMHWMTVPLANLHLGQLINEVFINDQKDWKQSHSSLLKQAYFKSLFYKDVIVLVDQAFSQSFNKLSDLLRASILALADYFGLTEPPVFLNSSELGIMGTSSRRVLDIILALGGKRYVTGLGARNYLNHQLFEQNGVIVEYMDYNLIKYPQMHGCFTPYVTALDLVANCGKEGFKYICSGTVGWREIAEVNK